MTPHRPLFAHGAAVRIAITREPVGGQDGHPLTVQPVLTAYDADNNMAVAYTGQVRCSIFSGVGHLAGTTTIPFVGGVATYTDLALTGPHWFRLKFDTADLPRAISARFGVRFDPRTIPGAHLIEAHDLTGLNDGDPVGTLVDSITRTARATAVGAARGKFVAAVPDANNQPGVRFDGATTSYAFSSRMAGTHGFVLAVVSPDNDIAPQARVFDAHDPVTGGLILQRHPVSGSLFGGGRNIDPAKPESGAYVPVGLGTHMLALLQGYPGRGTGTSSYALAEGDGWGTRGGWDSAVQPYGPAAVRIGSDQAGAHNFKGVLLALFWMPTAPTGLQEDRIKSYFEQVYNIPGYTMAGPSRYVVHANNWLGAGVSVRALVSPDMQPGHMGEVEAKRSGTGPGLDYMPTAGGSFVTNAHYLGRGKYPGDGKVWYIGSPIFSDFAARAPNFAIACSDATGGGVEIKPVGTIECNRGAAAGLWSVFRAQGSFRADGSFYVTVDCAMGAAFDLNSFIQCELHPLNDDPTTWGDSANWSAPVRIDTGLPANALQDWYCTCDSNGYYYARWFNYNSRAGEAVRKIQWGRAKDPLGPFAMLVTDSGLPGGSEGFDPFTMPDGSQAWLVDMVNAGLVGGGTGVVRQISGDWRIGTQVLSAVAALDLDAHGTQFSPKPHPCAVLDRAGLEP